MTAEPSLTAVATISESPEPPLAAIELTKAFRDHVVLDGLSLDIAKGDVVGLLGKNGAGKSTLIKCLLGLLRPTSGAARVWGESAWDLSASSKARLGYVPQEATAYPWMRVRQVIAYTAAFYPTWNQTLADTLCERWSLSLETRAGVLSTGQMQTLALVQALGHEPDLLVLDEPVASLDPSARREFLQTLVDALDERSPAGDGRRTVLFSTHITSDLERIASRVALLRDGRIALDRPLDELKESVKRLRITARNGDLPATLTVPNAVRLRREGRVATATVTDFHHELPAQLAGEFDADVAVIDLNLDEMFVELHDD